MADVNIVILAGRLTRDPELKYTPSGAPICNLDVAVNRTWMSASGEKKEDVLFVKINVWGKSGEACAQYLRKASTVLIEGRLTYRSWEARDGGGKRSAVEVTAERVQFLDGKGQGPDGSEGQAAPAAARTQAPPPPSDEDVPF